MNNNYYLLSSILEGKNEFPEYEQEMSSALKMFKKIFSGQVRLESEEEMIKKYLKNIEIQIIVQNDYIVNAMTLPGAESLDQYNELNRAIKTNQFSSDINHEPFKNMIDRLRKLNISQIKFKNGIVIFPKKLNFFMIVTKGFLVNLEPKERIAIYLHEIGHWYYSSKLIPKYMLLVEEEKNFNNIILFFIAISIYLRRFNEYDSDLFSAKAGYGKILSSIFKENKFTKFHVKLNWLLRLFNRSLKNFIKSENLRQEKDASGNYPSNKKRSEMIDKYLKDPIFRKEIGV